MSKLGGKILSVKQDEKNTYVKVKSKDLEKLTTEVMQLREFVPRVLNSDLTDMLQNARREEMKRETVEQQLEHLQKEYAHLKLRLDAAQMEGQKEKEEKLLLRQELWRSGNTFQQQSEFYMNMGASTCSLLWSCSSREDAVVLWVNDGKLPAFLTMAAQTLQSFLKSLEDSDRSEFDDPESTQHQFILALVGITTNIAAVTCGREFLSDFGSFLLDIFFKLLEVMRPTGFPKIKVLMLMALYNTSISVKGLNYIRENTDLTNAIWNLLGDSQWEVVMHCLRFIQSVVMDENIPAHLCPSLMSPEFHARVSQHTSSPNPALRSTALQMLEELKAIRPRK